MCFGTFDGLHEGHRFFLSEAASYGQLRVVIALDETVRAVKGRPPLRGQDERRAAVESAGYEAVLGNAGDKYAVIEAWEPDVICLGYDQSAFVDQLQQELVERCLSTVVVRLPAHQPETFKSSLLDAGRRNA